MNLAYKISFEFKVEQGLMFINMHSPFFQEEYPVPGGVHNLTAALSKALIDFNKLHEYKIEELQENEKAKVKTAKKQKPHSKEFTG